jgi:deferrochelatase/peroxidase EfeB
VHIETGTTWRHNGRTNREAFGFVDGISIPRFFANERRNRHPRDWEWIDLKLSDAFITPEQSEVHAGGSYMVFLKFEQNVRAYREHEAKINERLRMGDHGFHYAPALHVGRLRDGCPLHQAWHLPFPPESEFNRFDFRAPADANPRTTGCPFHAHIRKMNPRVDARDHGLHKERVIRSQPIRRGMLYDDRGELRRRGSHRGKPWPKDGCGLLFVAYMNDIARQFETLHNDWAIDPNFPLPGNGQLDGVLEPGRNPWEWRGTAMPPIERFIKRLGGHYFYVPSIPWLENRGYLSP